jgi:hypothetical protein
MNRRKLVETENSYRRTCPGYTNWCVSWNFGSTQQWSTSHLYTLRNKIYCLITALYQFSCETESSLPHFSKSFLVWLSHRTHACRCSQFFCFPNRTHAHTHTNRSVTPFYGLLQVYWLQIWSLKVTNMVDRSCFVLFTGTIGIFVWND